MSWLMKENELLKLEVENLNNELNLVRNNYLSNKIYDDICSATKKKLENISKKEEVCCVKGCNYWGIFNKTGDKNKPKYCELHRDNDMLNTYKRQQKCVNYKKCKKIAACHHDINGKHYCTVCFYNTCESFDAILPLRLSCIYCSSIDYN